MRFLILLILFPLFANSQPINYQGNSSSVSGFKGWVLSDSGYFFPNIKSNDTVLVGVATDSRGKSIPFTRSMFARWVNDGAFLTFQDVLSNGSDLTQQNDVNLNGFRFRFYGGKLDVDSLEAGHLYLVNRSSYTDDVGPFTGNDIPDAQFVTDYITEGYLDINVSGTITGLTLPTNRELVAIICDCGISYNNGWFSQAGTAVTFLNGLTFYSGYKLTLIFK